MKRLFKLPLLIVLCLGVLVGARFIHVTLKYPAIIERIELKRHELYEAYASAKSITERTEILNQAGHYLNDALSKDIMPAWWGTPWSFNGDADLPLHGSIACGSFVERVLQHAGFHIDSRMSIQPSEYIIKNLVNPRAIAKFSNISIKKFNDEVINMGEGIYIVGLDNHVGFLYISKAKYRFVHSHGYLCVVSEMPSLSPVLRMSKYRVVGKLFDDEMVERWLYGKDIPLRFDYFARHQ